MNLYNGIRALIVAVFIGGCVIGFEAQAAYALPTPPFGWGGSPGAWTYGGTAAANAPWVNGSAAAQVTVNVGGRPVTVPATMRFAANTGQFIARAGIVTQAVGRVVPFIAWALAAGWVWDQVAQRWRVPVTGSYWQACSTNGACGAVSPTQSEACASRWPEYGGGWADMGGGVYRCTNAPTGGSSLGNNGVLSAVTPPSGSTRDATNADADALGATPMPADLPGAVDDVLPLPMQLPEVTPWNVPTGLPYALPGTDPALFREPVVSILPAPDQNYPWRVDVRPGFVDSVDHLPMPSTGESADPEAQPAPDEAPTLCEENPDASACQPLGQPPSDTGVIPTQNINLEMPRGPSFGPDNAACPPPRVMQTSLAGPLEFSFEGACTFADGIRPVVVGLAFLGAALMFFGIGGRE